MVDAEGGEIFWTEPLYFVTVCGNASAGIIDAPFPDHITYEVDGFIPSFTINVFKTISTLCGIDRYELYEAKQDTAIHKHFSGRVEVNETSVDFFLEREKAGEFYYYLKVIAHGEEVFWTNEKLFEVRCGPRSARIILKEIPANYFFYVNGNMPFFYIAPYGTESAVCTIKSYTLYEDVSDPDNFIVHT